MKVMMISGDPGGGHAAYVNEVMAALARRQPKEVSVELIASKSLDPRFRNPAYVIHDVFPPTLRPRGENAAVWRIKLAAAILRSDRACLRWLRARHDCDALHFQTLSWFSVFQFWRYRRLGVPVFYTIHNVRPHRYVAPRVVEDAAMKSIWRQCAALFVHTEALKEETVAFLGRKHPPVFVAPHGLLRPSGNAPPTALVERLAWRKALFFGGIRRDKGLHTFLATMKNLDGVSLTIAGKPDRGDYWTKTVEPLVNELRAAGRRVDVTSEFIPDERVSALFKEHSFVVLPYTADFHAQSGILHLAMALETPVVASDVGGIAEVVERWHIGEMSPPDDPAALAAAVSRLWQRDPAQLEHDLKAAGETLSWDEMAQVLCDAYLSVGRSAASKAAS
jgi:glycosyltransferase involved in cell wall biosynthesis